MTTEDIYYQRVIELKQIKEKNIEKLKDKKEGVITELEIAVRVGHKVEEEYIRARLEMIIESIDMLNKFNFNFK